MDQPFRLSLYLRRLAQHWKLILIPTVVALLVAALLSWLMPVRYTATTVMVAPKQQLVWRWTNKVYDVVDIRSDWRAEVLPLVKTQATAEKALAQVGDQLSRKYTTAQVLAATSVQAGPGSTFTIRVKTENPQDAALLANALAQALPDVVADLYAGNVEAFQQAQERVKQGFAEWDERWRRYRSTYGIGLGFTGDLAGVGEDTIYGNQSAIKQELTIKSSQVAELQVFRDKVARVLDGLQQGAETPSLALLDESMLARYGLNQAALRTLAPAQQQKTLTDLLAQVDADLQALEEDLQAFQARTATILQEKETILRERGNWYDSLKALGDKQIELQVKRLVEGQRVQQVSQAQIPEKPSQPNWGLNMGLALAAGLLAGLFLAVTAVYFGPNP